MTDRQPNRDGEPSSPGESYRLAAPGPFGSPWTRATLGSEAVTLEREGARTTVPYATLRAVDSVPVSEEHGEARIAVDLVVLGAHIVLAAGAGLARRLGDHDAAAPARTARYANEVVASTPLVRLRLATDERAYYLYADPETARSLSSALRARKGGEA